LQRNYCKIFVLPSPDDPEKIWGFYSLSPASMSTEGLSRADKGRSINNIPAPMALIGYMGRCDTAQKGIGGILITDAARRVSRIEDFGIWGLMLEAEDGPEGQKLWDWYLAQKFKPVGDPQRPRALFARLQTLIPT
jgi:hypothetical protein